MALAKTLRNRPELLAGAALTEEDAVLFDELQGQNQTRSAGIPEKAKHRGHRGAGRTEK
jgi:hypothetical protein